ncbi:hypothetical protein Q1695_005840 [Nippostrongylus brasiliensis]|nr:hypothetical protein Q1695_005840 [Nippostrongylus brasiliensis]
MDDPFSEEFDANAVLDRSPDEPTPEDVSESVEEFERTLVAEHPELARLICALDRPPGEKSKKQQKRDRVARLQEMTVSGRSLFEPRVQPAAPSQSTPSLNDILDTVHNQWSTGPMSLLYRAMKERCRVEIRIRSLNRIDRIACGYVVAFDRHMNVMVRDVDELALPGRKEERLYGRRKPQEDRLPLAMRWQIGGDWPLPIGHCRRVLSRYLPCSMIKGETIVLFRLLHL